MLTLRVSLPRTAAAVLVAVAGSACGSAVTATAPIATPGATSATVGGIATSTGVPSRTHDAPVSAPLQDNPGVFGLRDVFELEFAADPRISPDGSRIAYVRTSMDVMTDRPVRAIWTIDRAGKSHRPLVTGPGDVSSPRWSPTGDRLLYVGAEGDRAQLFLRWMDTGQTARLTNLAASPGNLAWSPDGSHIAFTMLAADKPPEFVKLPTPPEGAKWAEPPTAIDRLVYRIDGRGYSPHGYVHMFVLPADGGTPRQLTTGRFHHDSTLSWTPDGTAVLLSANRHPDWEYEPVDSEIYEVTVATGAIRALTNRRGADARPAVSPDGTRVAYVGFDDQRHGYHVSQLYVMNRDGSSPRAILPALDRDIEQVAWSQDSRGLFISYDDRGNTKLAYADLRGGKPRVITGDVGGTSIGRPYTSGSFTVARDGTLAYTLSRPDHPADVASTSARGTPRRLTHLNDDLFAGKALGQVEEFWFASSHDQRKVQGWIVKPPGFDASRRYPLVLEIHGGPHAAYGDRFTAECQLFAAAGHVVVYINPRGSKSYGKEFGNLIHHNYPGNDYDDLMSGIDEVVSRGYVDPERLYVTGGSGGGVLTSWIVGKTDRFRAAVVAKPVINWHSFVLTADFSAFFTRYWFPGPPWEHAEHYQKLSPLSLVGNVSTPTMLLTGEDDFRTPISESEQYYKALKLRKVDAMLVRIPGASHAIAARPSQLVAKVAYILGWFERYDTRPTPTN